VYNSFLLVSTGLNISLRIAFQGTAAPFHISPHRGITPTHALPPAYRQAGIEGEGLCYDILILDKYSIDDFFAKRYPLG